MSTIWRFEHAWEREASLKLRAGDFGAITDYEQHQRIRHGSYLDMVDQAYLNWQSDIQAGRSSILIAADNDTVGMLNERAQADRMIEGLVDAEQTALLGDGLRAGRGDTVIVRRNDRTVADSNGDFIRNGTLLDVVQAGRRDGSLVALRRDTGATVTLHRGLAARHGALDGNPLRDVATIPTNHKEVRALTVTEVGALRAGLRQWEAEKKQAGRYPTVDILDVIDIMLATGARISEALAIRWKDVDLKSEKPTVTVNGTIVYMPKQGLTIQDHPKSANSRQRYFLPTFAVEMLLRQQIGQLEANPWDVVFPSAVGSLRDPNNFHREWRSAR
ncbi:hypothetical protein ABH924_004502 [Arthrobacter sp. GAS37]